MTIIETPEGIEAFRLLSCYERMKLELRGLRFRINTFPAIKREFGFKGSNAKVLEQYEAMLRERGIL